MYVRLCVCMYVIVHVGKFHINWRHLLGFSPTKWRHAYQPATSLVCKIPCFLGHVWLVGLVECALEFMDRIELLG